jgi:hypothetical protein
MGKGKKKAKDAPSLAEKKRAGKLERSLGALEVWLAACRDTYAEYIRLHRLLYDCDPDPSDVSIEWPSEED